MLNKRREEGEGSGGKVKKPEKDGCLCMEFNITIKRLRPNTVYVPGGVTKDTVYVLCQAVLYSERAEKGSRQHFLLEIT